VLPIVIDTNVVVAALRSDGGASRQVVRGCLAGFYEPLFGLALLTEYKHAAYGLPSVSRDDASDTG
jgi:predicted nucleic acid-binding protein